VRWWYETELDSAYVIHERTLYTDYVFVHVYIYDHVIIWIVSVKKNENCPYNILPHQTEFRPETHQVSDLPIVDDVVIVVGISPAGGHWPHD
jgi:hypothetical protein